MGVRLVVIRAMQRREVSQRELASRALVDRARLNRWLNGKGTMTVESLERMMAVLGLAMIEAIVEGEGRGA